MIARILGSPWALVLGLTLGPLLIYWIRKKSKERDLREREREGGRAPHSTEKARDQGASSPPVGGPREAATSGFRDLRWGDAPAPDMTVVHDGGDERLFTRPKDELMLDSAPLNSILYSFHRGRFQAVMIEMSLGSGERVFNARCAAWGKPKVIPPARYFWAFATGGMDATQAVYERNPSTAKSSLIISSKYIKDLREKERAASARDVAAKT